MGDAGACPKCGKHEKREVLSIFREMWRKPDSPLHRIYSSWEELEQHVEIATEDAGEKEKFAVHPCPNCGVKLKITEPLEGFFPYQNCKACEQAYYVNKDLTVRALTEDEKREIPKSWIQIVDGLSKKKCAVVFRLE
jgi:ssDNA-binding Zn-finger/Zn-ribbon topoisomerase 1